MGTLEIKIINPKAAKLLKGLEELKLISIKDTQSELASVLKKGGINHRSDLGKNISLETYPFKPRYLIFNDTNYILREKLDTIVSYEDGQYIISNELLNILVWGKTRDEAEEAFAFAFHSLYENYVKESDKNLTPGARRLKKTLKNLVANVM